MKKTVKEGYRLIVIYEDNGRVYPVNYTQIQEQQHVVDTNTTYYGNYPVLKRIWYKGTTEVPESEVLEVSPPEVGTYWIWGNDSEVIRLEVILNGRYHLFTKDGFHIADFMPEAPPRHLVQVANWEGDKLC